MQVKDFLEITAKMFFYLSQTYGYINTLFGYIALIVFAYRITFLSCYANLTSEMFAVGHMSWNEIQRTMFSTYYIVHQ